MDKELQQWLNARGQNKNEKQSDIEKLKQQQKNRINNARGQHFEREILAGCKMYERYGIALIDKTPEPFMVAKKGKDGMFVGRFCKTAQPDFQGTLKGGRSIIFEAKRTSKDRIARNVLTETQMRLLAKHRQYGAITGVCVNIQDDFFFVPFVVWEEMKQRYGRQYVTVEDIKEYQVKFDGAVHFLEHIEELKESEEK